MRTSIVFLAALTITPFGCSSSADGPSTATDSGAGTDSGMGTDTATAMDSGMDMGGEDTMTGSDADAASTTKPAAPTLVSVEKMSGSLHVTWKLNDTGLTNVFVFRKKDAGAYAKAYTLPGTATAQHDMGASSAGSTYCYQVQTVKAGAMSDLSNELCGSP